MNKNKKGISGIVAITLLILMTVVVGVGFQVWYKNYSSGLLTRNEVSGNSATNPIKLDKIVGKTLYIVNPSGNNISVDKIDLNGVDCDINGTYSGNLVQIELPTLCINAIDSNRMPEIVFQTDNLLLSKRVDYKYLSSLASSIFSSYDVTNAELNTLIESDEITLSGIGENVLITISGDGSPEIGFSSPNYHEFATGGGASTFARRNLGAYSGSYSWDFGNGSYLDNSDAWLISTPIDLSSYSSASLSFYHWRDLEDDYDGGNLKISNNTEGPWTLITPVGGYDGSFDSFSEDGWFGTVGWEQVVFNLDSYIGQTIYLKWHAGSDSSATQTGWRIDDINITADGNTIFIDDAETLTWSNSGTFSDGDKIKLRLLSANSYVTKRTANIDIGGNSETWSVTTKIQDRIPDSFSFLNFNGGYGLQISSNTFSPIGYDGPLEVSVSGQGSPLFKINNGAWVSSGTINNGDNISLILTNQEQFESSRSAVLTIGDYSTTWSPTVGKESLSCITDLDSDGYISSSCAQYPMGNATFEGHLDANDNNATITVDMSCVFNNDKSGCLSNYVVDGCGSGTVLDIGTGLCWQRNFGSGGQRNWTNAKSYCDSLVLGGHSDWYLPSRQEFETIVDLTRTAPHIAGGNNNKFTSVVSSYYWTKTTYGPSTTNAFYVRLDYGTSSVTSKTNGYYVACVRRH